MNFVKNYLEELKLRLDKLDPGRVEKIVDVLINAWKNDRQIFIIGNGGSAAIASHLACDLGKGTLKKIHDISEKRFRVSSLTDNTPLLTALANDVAYENVFAQQLYNCIGMGDILIAITGSGNSENILKALRVAQDKKAITVAFLGSDGGKAKNLSDYYIIYEDVHYGRIEDSHSILSHLICCWIREKIDNLKGGGRYFKEDAGREKQKKTIFLDRDGVINKNAAEHDYIKTL